MKIKIAILDLYDGYANQGMRCLHELINSWGKKNEHNIKLDEFNVRQKNEVPDTSYDIYISTGGPGSPIDSEGTEWENKYFTWIKSIVEWNNNIENYPKKNIFFICHSFQLACRYFNLALVSKRKSRAFGVFPIHMLDEAKDEIVFEGLRDPFYGVDSRDYQVTQVNQDVAEKIGAKVLAIEKERPHVVYERAIMAMRFSENFIGTQFHPEADAIGMSIHLQTQDRKQTVIENHGEAKWQSMIDQLNDPDKIMWTYNHIFPNFLNNAVGELV